MAVEYKVVQHDPEKMAWRYEATYNGELVGTIVQYGTKLDLAYKGEFFKIKDFPEATKIIENGEATEENYDAEDLETGYTEDEDLDDEVSDLFNSDS